MKKIYSIFDLKAQSYGVPFTCDNDALARRLVSDCILQGSNPDYHNHPEDFNLVCLGEFDHVSGSGQFTSPVTVDSFLTIVAYLDACRQRYQQMRDSMASLPSNSDEVKE